MWLYKERMCGTCRNRLWDDMGPYSARGEETSPTTREEMKTYLVIFYWYTKSLTFVSALSN